MTNICKTHMHTIKVQLLVFNPNQTLKCAQLLNCYTIAGKAKHIKRV